MTIAIYAPQFGIQFKENGHWYLLHAEFARALQEQSVDFVYLLTQDLKNFEPYVSDIRIPDSLKAGLTQSFKSRGRILNSIVESQCSSVFIYEGNLDLIVLIQYH
jgi:hypothetical protein